MKKNFFVYKFMKKNFSTWLSTEGLNTKKFTVHYACRNTDLNLILVVVMRNGSVL